MCLRYVINGETKETFVSFFATASTEGEVLYELAKTAINKLDLRLENIIAECFDGAANMSGIRKGLATRMKECSPLGIYVHCYAHLLNLALQDTMSEIETLRNALGTTQSLNNFLHGSTKRHALFKDIEIHEEDVALTLKSLSTTRWSCRWAAVRAVLEQVPRIMEALVTLSKDRDPKTYNESNSLLHSICDFEFVYGLMVLKLILSNTDNLSRYLQGEQMDVITAKKTADAVVKTLSNCRNEESFTQVWSHADVIAQKLKIGIEGTQFLPSEMPRCLEPDHHADFRALLVRHLLQRTTAHNRRQKTTFVSQFITQVLTKSSVNFNQGLRAMTRKFCAHWAKSYSAVL